MIRILIVEDEPAAAASLMEHVNHYQEARGEKFDVQWLKSAIDMLETRRRFDICFLDIDLPGISGLEAAHLLRSLNQLTSIVFVTNLAKLAIRGYEVDATGFIVKPATYTSTALALDKALCETRRHEHRTLTVATDDDMYVIGFDSMLYASIHGHELTCHLSDGTTLTTRGSLAKLEADLEDAPTVKVSRSVIANMDLISSIRGNDVVMVNGEKLRIARGRKPPIEDALIGYLGGRGK